MEGWRVGVRVGARRVAAAVAVAVGGTLAVGVAVGGGEVSVGGRGVGDGVIGVGEGRSVAVGDGSIVGGASVVAGANVGSEALVAVAVEVGCSPPPPPMMFTKTTSPTSPPKTINPARLKPNSRGDKRQVGAVRVGGERPTATLAEAGPGAGYVSSDGSAGFGGRASGKDFVGGATAPWGAGETEGETEAAGDLIGAVTSALRARTNAPAVA